MSSNFPPSTSGVSAVTQWGWLPVHHPGRQSESGGGGRRVPYIYRPYVMCVTVVSVFGLHCIFSRPTTWQRWVAFLAPSWGTMLGPQEHRNAFHWFAFRDCRSLFVFLSRCHSFIWNSTGIRVCLRVFMSPTTLMWTPQSSLSQYISLTEWTPVLCLFWGFANIPLITVYFFSLFPQNSRKCVQLLSCVTLHTWRNLQPCTDTPALKWNNAFTWPTFCTSWDSCVEILMYKEGLWYQVPAAALFLFDIHTPDRDSSWRTTVSSTSLY